MSGRRAFDERQLTGWLERIGRALKRKVTAYLIGGCAMVLRGQKLATKDVDLVLASAEELKHLVETLKAMDFHEIVRLPEEYKRLGASAIMRDGGGFQLDLFHRQVCRGLELTERMERRAQAFKDFNNLEIRLMSAEDIFLLKGVTERQADLEDMRILLERGLDWNIIKQECLLQEKRRIWEDLLVNNLIKLKERYGIESPITKDLIESADLEVAKRAFTKIILEGNETSAQIANAVKERYGYSESWTRAVLGELTQKGVLSRVRAGRGYRYSTKDRK